MSTGLTGLDIVSCDWLRGCKCAVKQGCMVHVPPEVYSLMGDGQRTLELICQHLWVVELPLVKFLEPEMPAMNFTGFRVCVKRKSAECVS